jgi:hypothetical protein
LANIIQESFPSGRTELAVWKITLSSRQNPYGMNTESCSD